MPDLYTHLLQQICPHKHLLGQQVQPGKHIVIITFHETLREQNIIKKRKIMLPDLCRMVSAPEAKHDLHPLLY